MRAADDLRLDILDSPFGGPTQRTAKPGGTARHAAGLRESLGWGRRVSIPGRPDLGLACVSFGLGRRGLLCDLNVVSDFPPSELAVLRRASIPARWTCCVYLTDLVRR